tara:strand:- start:383 stop:1714 length:1332 start_codon:yes stop_codon:yes gene_type:complete
MKNILNKLFMFIILGSVYSNCVTFSLDLNNFNEEPQGDWVPRANGSWNTWGIGITLNDNDGDNIYTATDCSFSNGTYEFVFAITGVFDNWSNWGLSSGPPILSDCDYSPNDNYANYGFLVENNDVILDTHKWGCCGIDYCSEWDGCEAGALQTSDSYLYGRFEVRMKSADGDGIVSSFFTYNTNWESEVGNLNWNEIDIEMTGNRDNSVQFTTHHPGDPNSWSYGEIIGVEFNPHIGFHDYAFEWTPDYISWFVDDQEVYQQGANIVDDLNFSQKIMMNIWPAIWEDWVGEWDNQDTPKHAYYDYVRYYSYTPNDGNYGTNNNFKLLWEDHFDILDEEIWIDNSSGTFGGNLCSFTPQNTNIYNGHLILSLTDVNNEINCNEVTADINIDDLLNVVDVVSLVDIILNDSFASLGTCQFLAVDTDFNQILNIVDIVEIVTIIIN